MARSCEFVGNDGKKTEYLLTVWEDGAAQIANRRKDSGDTWSPGVELHPVVVEQPAEVPD